VIIKCQAYDDTLDSKHVATQQNTRVQLYQRFCLLIIHIAVDCAFRNVFLWKLLWKICILRFPVKHQFIFPRKLY